MERDYIEKDTIEWGKIAWIRHYSSLLFPHSTYQDLGLLNRVWIV
jgi:hypothetical protein